MHKVFMFHYTWHLIEQREFMNKDLDKESLLKFPGLREADKKILEDAWRTYRPLLLEKIQQALTLGCDWKKILQKLNLAFSDAKSGYPRLKQYVELALEQLLRERRRAGRDLRHLTERAPPVAPVRDESVRRGVGR